MLQYTGSGAAIGIPARDLNDEEVAAYGGEAALLALRGSDNLPLYEKVAPKPMRPQKDGE